MVHSSIEDQGLKGPTLEPQITQMAQIKGFIIREIRVIRGQKQGDGKVEEQNMETKFDEISTAALQLSVEERAQLAGSLLLSLDEPSESEVERLWLEEAEHRLKEFRKGEVRGIPADEVFRRAMDDIS